MKKYLFISLGAMIGALLRSSISFATVSGASPFFMGTLIVNMSGAFVAGVLLRRFHDREGHLRDFLITGLLGSFTTFSMLTYEQYLLLSYGEYFIFIIYLAVNMAGGFCLALLGWKAGGMGR
ncbi:fluoride efflux transporter FluC [Salinicoccus bachuensis]|uniref:Fluoride-specific ion channel FluC n=1 Tax=Salinicoccus bachuensis TaxID=3136731 RepID=A0ABZ3CF08_9STAP